MLRIGEFSKMARTTVKALRFYEEEGLLRPAKVDPFTGYRYYTTAQLYHVQRILALRQAGLSIPEISEVLKGGDPARVLRERMECLLREQTELQARVNRLSALMESAKEDETMKYQAMVKEIPACTVYARRGRVSNLEEMTALILKSGEECLAANPDVKCLEPDYCFVTWPGTEYREENALIEYAQAVEKAGRDTNEITFKSLPAQNCVCVMHKGGYDGLREAYAFAANWAEKNGWEVAGLPRERYIDGMWNCEKEADWLTEIQLPVANYEAEVEARWGETESFRQSKGKKNGGMDQMKEANAIFDAFAALRQGDPACQEAQALVEKWRENITRTSYDCSVPMLKCLAEMYITDERFMKNLDSHGTGTAKFMHDAMMAYCRNNQ